MVQSVENLSQISGRILERRPHATLADYDVVSLQVEAAAPVPGKANLLESVVGTVTQVSVRRALLGNVSKGGKLRCRARRTMDGAMCEPHPNPADFVVSD